MYLFEKHYVGQFEGKNFLHTLLEPTLEYCPSDNSKKKAGMPTKNNMTTYGTKNDPPPFS